MLHTVWSFLSIFTPFIKIEWYTLNLSSDLSSIRTQKVLFSPTSGHLSDNLITESDFPPSKTYIWV